MSGGQDGGPAGPELEPLGPEGEQGSLFAEEVFGDGPPSGDVVGYRGPAACQIVGITYRQLDYWARTKLVVPSIRSATGSGSQRLYSFKDLAVLKVVKNLLDTGVSLNNIRVAVEQLRRHGVRDLARITLFSDGVTVYECTSPGGGRRPAAGRPGRLRDRRRRGHAGDLRQHRALPRRAGRHRRRRPVAGGRAGLAPQPRSPLRRLTPSG